jgi:hypothetical protein
MVQADYRLPSSARSRNERLSACIAANPLAQAAAATSAIMLRIRQRKPPRRIVLAFTCHAR